MRRSWAPLSSRGITLIPVTGDEPMIQALYFDSNISSYLKNAGGFDGKPDEVVVLFKTTTGILLPGSNYV
jgi:hypothetical protein